jgi:predicted transcriptional regulator
MREVNGRVRSPSAVAGKSTHNFIELTSEVVSAYVANNSVASADLPGLIAQVHAALLRAANGDLVGASEKSKPAVPVKRSIHADYLICLEDGKKFKSLKRHLSSEFKLTPDQYREKWNLPRDYPMVAPNYAAKRSDLAKKMGLGQRRRRRR